MVGHRNRQVKTLQVMQVNVGKVSASHDIALSFAHDYHFDIILIQEPWIHRDRLRRISKRHPAYRCFSPVEDWANRPRVLTYVRKDPQLHAAQLRDGGESSRDLLTIQLAAWGQQICFINVYNAPPGSKNPGQVFHPTLRWLNNLVSWLNPQHLDSLATKAPNNLSFITA